jgi:GDP-4-dehydro-6-deoxy-D-mannose reductase
MRVLLTGASGFVGSRILARAAAGVWAGSVEPVPTPDAMDVTDRAGVGRVLDAVAFDAVLHLAAHSSISASWTTPEETFRVNALGTAVLCHGLAERQFAGPVLIVSSADCYGTVAPVDLPVPETRPPAPMSPYAASKLAAEVAALQWHRSHGLRVVVARAFNHTGIGQRPVFALPSFARQIARVLAGRQDRVLTGDLDVTRDMAWVDDVVEAYWDLLRLGEAGGLYNVCSGREQNLDTILRRMLHLAGCDGVAARDPAQVRAHDVRRSAGDPGRLVRLAGRCPPPLSDAHLTALIRYWIDREAANIEDDR